MFMESRMCNRVKQSGCLFSNLFNVYQNRLIEIYVVLRKSNSSHIYIIMVTIMWWSIVMLMTLVYYLQRSQSLISMLKMFELYAYDYDVILVLKN